MVVIAKSKLQIKYLQFPWQDHKSENNLAYDYERSIFAVFKITLMLSNNCVLKYHEFYKNLV